VILTQTADPDFNQLLMREAPLQSAVAAPVVGLPNDDDRQRPARGIGLAVLMALPLWALVALAIYFMV